MIVGFGIKSISGERKNIPKGRIDVNSTPFILSVSKSSEGLFRKEKPLNIDFEFVIKYEPDIGEIKIKGNVFYVGKNMKEILKIWHKEKKLSKESEIEVKNFLFRKCLTIGVNLTENMQLPPPIIFPRVALQKKEDLSYIG